MCLKPFDRKLLLDFKNLTSREMQMGILNHTLAGEQVACICGTQLRNFWIEYEVEFYKLSNVQYESTFLSTNQD